MYLDTVQVSGTTIVCKYSFVTKGLIVLVPVILHPLLSASVSSLCLRSFKILRNTNERSPHCILATRGCNNLNTTNNNNTYPIIVVLHYNDEFLLTNILLSI